MATTFYAVTGWLWWFVVLSERNLCVMDQIITHVWSTCATQGVPSRALALCPCSQKGSMWMVWWHHWAQHRQEYWDQGVVVFDNLDTEQKSLLFIALRMTLVCKICTSFDIFHLWRICTLQEKLQAFPIARTAHLCVHNQQTHIPTDRAITLLSLYPCYTCACMR